MRCPRPEQQTLLRRIPGARLVACEGVGHSPHLEAPDRVAAALQAFVDGLGSCATDVGAARRA